MGKGGYNGGSTIVGAGSGWFSKPKQKQKSTPEQQAAFLERLAKRQAADRANRRAEAARRTAASDAKREQLRKKTEALRSSCPPKRDPVEVAAKLAQRMEGVVVEVRREGRTILRKAPISKT